MSAFPDDIDYADEARDERMAALNHARRMDADCSRTPTCTCAKCDPSTDEETPEQE